MFNHIYREDSVDYGSISRSDYRTHVDYKPISLGNTQTTSASQYTFYCSENTLQSVKQSSMNCTVSNYDPYLYPESLPENILLLYNLTGSTTGSASPAPEVRSIVELHNDGEARAVSYHTSSTTQRKFFAYHVKHIEQEVDRPPDYAEEIQSKTIIPLVISIDAEHKTSCQDLFSLEEATIVQIATHNTCRRLSDRETITPREREEDRCTVSFSVKRDTHLLAQLCPSKKRCFEDFTITQKDNEYIVAVTCSHARARECLTLYKEQLSQSRTDERNKSFTAKLAQIAKKPLVRAMFCFVAFLAVKHLVYYLHKGRNNKKYTFLDEINNPYTIATLAIAKVLLLTLVIYHLIQYYRLFRYEISKHEDQRELLDVAISSLEPKRSDEVNEVQVSMITDDSERLYFQ